MAGDQLWHADTPEEPDHPRERDGRDAWRTRTDFGWETGDTAADEIEAEPTLDDGEGAEPDRPERGWATIFEKTGELTSYRSFTAAKRDLGSLSGTEIHHLVEQSQAAKSGFAVERINTTDNLTRIPTDIHRQISRTTRGFRPAGPNGCVTCSPGMIGTTSTSTGATLSTRS